MVIAYFMRKYFCLLEKKERKTKKIKKKEMEIRENNSLRYNEEINQFIG